MSYTAIVNDATLQNNASYVDASQNHECAIFVQAVAYAPQTQFWKKGKNVLSSPVGSISRGTAIVMFSGDNYKTSSVKHAAIYVSHDANSITVYDQWNNQSMVKKRVIRKKLIVDISVNNALLYYVLE